MATEAKRDGETNVFESGEEDLELVAIGENGNIVVVAKTDEGGAELESAGVGLTLGNGAVDRNREDRDVESGTLVGDDCER